MKKSLYLCAALALASCGDANPPLNTNGTPTTAAEQAAAAVTEAYLVADAAYIAYLNGAPSPAVVAQIEPKRQAASAALTAFTNSVKTGAAVSVPQALTAALAAFSAVLAANNINAGG